MEKAKKWDIKKLRVLSEQTGLKINQLYKWNWDRINKEKAV
jgi:hypothetical protein